MYFFYTVHFCYENLISRIVMGSGCFHNTELLKIRTSAAGSHPQKRYRTGSRSVLRLISGV